MRSVLNLSLDAERERIFHRGLVRGNKNSSVHHCMSDSLVSTILIMPVHEISNNVVCATSKGSDQPAHTRSLIRAFASLLSIL